MKIKWLYIFLSFLTLTLLAGSSAFIFYDGSTGIELQREDNQGHLKVNSYFVDFIYNYKSLINSEFNSINQYKKKEEGFLRSLSTIEDELNHSQLIHTLKIKEIIDKLKKLTIRKVDLTLSQSHLQQQRDLTWKELEDFLVEEINLRVENREEFLPELNKKLDSWMKSLTILKKLKNSINVSYVTENKFKELQELIEFSRWLISFKTRVINAQDISLDSKNLILEKAKDLELPKKVKGKIRESIISHFDVLIKYSHIIKELKNSSLRIDKLRDESSLFFEENILPGWEEYLSRRYDSGLSARYSRLKKVVSIVSVAGGLIILSMLFVFLQIFPNLKKLEEKAKQVASGNYEAKFNQRIPSSEIGNVMRAFNDMSSQISIYLKEVEKKESEKLQLNESIQKVKRLSQLGEFSAKMAHELKNPISILNFCLNDAFENLKEQNLDQTKIEIENSLNAMERIKFTVGKLGVKSIYSNKERINLVELLEEIDHMYRALLLKERIVLMVSKKSSPLFIFAPRLELTGAIANLIDNAIECIRACMPKDSALYIDLYEESGHAVLKVLNGGPAIENSENIFNAVYSSKKGNIRGLGLIIVKDVVDECNGKITYEYKNEMNTFKIIFPLL